MIVGDKILFTAENNPVFGGHIIGGSVVVDYLTGCPTFDVFKTGAFLRIVARQRLDKRKHVLAHLLTVWIRQFLVKLLTDQFLLVGNEQSLASPQRQQGHAHRIKIYFRIGISRLPGNVDVKFRSCVDFGSPVVADSPAVLVKNLGKAPVGKHESRPCLVGKHEIGRLDIAMNNAFSMQKVYSCRHLQSNLFQLPLFAFELYGGERAARAELHYLIIEVNALLIVVPCAMVIYVNKQSAATQLHDSVKHGMVRTDAIPVHFQSISLPVGLDLENLGFARLLADDTHIAVLHFIKHKDRINGHITALRSPLGYIGCACIAFLRSALPPSRT